MKILFRKFKNRWKNAAFCKIWEDTISGLGDFIGLRDTTQDTVTNEMYDIYYQVLIFKKMKIQLKLVYNDKMIVGLWMNYIGG